MKKALLLAIFAITLTIGIVAAETFTNPVAPGADPFVLKDDDGTYYLYATGGDTYGYRVFSSKNLVEWTAHGYCLNREDVYIDPTSPEVASAPYGETNYLFWAPEVLKYDGKYYLVYSAQRHIGIAVSDSPLGPFKNNESSFLIPSFLAIDGNFFVDKDGKVYLYFSTAGVARFGEQSVHQGQNIWGGELDMTTLKLKEDTVRLLLEWDLDYDPIPLLEGPFMIENDGKYYLTFSSGDAVKTHYSVHCAVGTSPLGEFVRDTENIVLKCDDLDYADRANPHLYGTAHHSFVEAPNGKDLLIVYQTHRTNFTYNTGISDFCSPRSVCIDYAWFDSDGVLRAGKKDAPSVPTATPQPLLEGTVLEREEHYTGTFEKLSALPTLYVSYLDGSDENEGTKEAPLRTLDRAMRKLAKGGTVVLTQSYTLSGHFDAVSSRGPIMITAEHNNVVLTFEYISFNSPVYLENIVLAPESREEIAVIECNFNEVVVGEGVSCLNRPYGEREFPYLVGGRWNYGGSSKDEVFNGFVYDADKLSSTKSYTLTVLGGKWGGVTVGTLDYKTPLDGSAVGGKLITEVQSPEKTEIKMTLGDLSAYVNGAKKTLDAAPVIKNSRTMLPIRFVAESLGASVLWDDVTRTVTVKSEAAPVEKVTGANTARVNGNEISLDSAAFIENSRTYLPVRFVAENLGASVLWDDATKTVTIVK